MFVLFRKSMCRTSLVHWRIFLYPYSWLGDLKPPRCWIWKNSFGIKNFFLSISLFSLKEALLPFLCGSIRSVYLNIPFFYCKTRGGRLAPNSDSGGIRKLWGVFRVFRKAFMNKKNQWVVCKKMWKFIKGIFRWKKMQVYDKCTTKCTTSSAGGYLGTNQMLYHVKNLNDII